MSICANDINQDIHLQYLCARIAEPYGINTVNNSPDGVIVTDSNKGSFFRGRKQESWRDKFGIKLDQNSQDGVVITGHTIESIKDLMLAASAAKKEALAHENKTARDEVIKLLDSIQKLQETLGIEIATLDKLKRTVPDFEDFDANYNESYHIRLAKNYLESEKAWLDKAIPCRPQIDQLRNIFGIDQIRLDSSGLNGNDFTIDYNVAVMTRLIENPAMAQNVDQRNWQLLDAIQSNLKTQGIEMETSRHGIRGEETSWSFTTSDDAIAEAFSSHFGFSVWHLQIDRDYEDCTTLTKKPILDETYEEVSPSRLYRWNSIDVTCILEDMDQKARTFDPNFSPGRA